MKKKKKKPAIEQQGNKIGVVSIQAPGGELTESDKESIKLMLAKLGL